MDRVEILVTRGIAAMQVTAPPGLLTGSGTGTGESAGRASMHVTTDRGSGVLRKGSIATDQIDSCVVPGESRWSGQWCEASTASGGIASGMVKENVAPWPGVLSIQIVPPWPCTIRLAIARPNPDPAERRAASVL